MDPPSWIRFDDKCYELFMQFLKGITDEKEKFTFKFNERTGRYWILVLALIKYIKFDTDCCLFSAIYNHKMNPQCRRWPTLATKWYSFLINMDMEYD